MTMDHAGNLHIGLPRRTVYGTPASQMWAIRSDICKALLCLEAVKSVSSMRVICLWLYDANPATCGNNHVVLWRRLKATGQSMRGLAFWNPKFKIAYRLIRHAQQPQLTSRLGLENGYYQNNLLAYRRPASATRKVCLKLRSTILTSQEPNVPTPMAVRPKDHALHLPYCG